MAEAEIEHLYVNIDPEYANYSNEVDRPMHLAEVKDHNLPARFANDFEVDSQISFKQEPDVADDTVNDLPKTPAFNPEKPEDEKKGGDEKTTPTAPSLPQPPATKKD